MLSTETPPGSSCSSKLPKILASQEEDPDILEKRATPNFSIRDYVFASRSKGIEASWPFAPQLLQLCLDHGVRDLLPPFEQPDLVRAKSINKVAKHTQPVASSEVPTVSDTDPANGKPATNQKDSGFTLKGLALDSLDRAGYPSQRDRKSTLCQRLLVVELNHNNVGVASASGTRPQAEKITSQIGLHPCSVSGDISSSDPSCSCSNEKVENKKRQIVKLGTISESSQTEEDLVHNSGMHLDPMASKVCPVCKTFSFTSNTTLNAHIDQCLSMRSDSKEVPSDAPKYKVKPRKKRLMADIYATAPRCTLEDLDKRNGTNRSSELALLVAPTDGLAGHPKSSTHDRNGTDYVDSHGVKLRILSKFNDRESSRENFKLRKHANEAKPSKGHLTSKKKHFAPTCLKKMKLKAEWEQLMSSNMMKSQIQAAADVDSDSESHQKNDKSLSHVSNSGEQEKMISSATTVKQWACSRRSDNPQKLTKKDNCGTSEDMAPAGNMNLQPDSGNSTDVRTQLKKFSRSSGNLTCFSKTNGINFLYDGIKNIDERKREPLELPSPSSRSSSEGISLVNGLVLRLSKSLGSFTCSSVAKTKENHMVTQEQFGCSSDKKMALANSILEDQRKSTSKKDVIVRRPFGLEARKAGAIGKPSISEKCRKHRTVLSVKKGGALQSSNTVACGPIDNVCILRTVENKDIIVGEGEVMNEVSPRGINIAEYSNIMEAQKKNILENPSSEAQHCDAEIETSFMQVQISSSRDYETETSPEVVRDLIAVASTNSEKFQLPSSTHFDVAHPEQLKQSSKKQQKISGDGPPNDTGSLDIQVAGFEGRRDSHTIQPPQYPGDTYSNNESNGCLTSHDDASGKSSSMNSIGRTASHAKYLSNKVEASGSPVSTASASLPSPTDTKSQEVEPFSRAASVQYNLHSTIPSAESIEVTQERNLENTKQEDKGGLPDKEPNKSSDDKRACCSCRENVSKESELFRQTGKTSKPKQLLNLSVRPRNSSSFSVYRGNKNNAAGNSETRPPTQLNPAKSSLDLSVKVPNCGNICSPSPSPQSQTHSVSSPILRLMGKNLMVVNNEELVRPQPTASDSTRQSNVSSYGYDLTNNHLRQQVFWCQHNQLFSGSPPAFAPAFPLNLPSTPAGGGVAWAPSQNGCITKQDQQTRPRKPLKRLNSSYHSMDEVIAIDEALEHKMNRKGRPATSASASLQTNSGLSRPLSHRPFSCYPLQHQATGYLRPLFPNVYSSFNSTSFVNQGIMLEGQGSFLPSPNLFQSPTGQRVSLVYYYPRTLH